MTPDDQRCERDCLDILDSWESHSSQELLHAVKGLVNAQSVEVLEFLLYLWTNTGPAVEVGCADYGGFGGYHFEICHPDFPNVRDRDFRRQLGDAMVSYRVHQNLISDLLQEHASLLWNGYYGEAKRIADSIEDDRCRELLKRRQSDLEELLHKSVTTGFDHYFSIYKALEAHLRAWLVQQQNAFAVLDDTIRKVAMRLARSGDDKAIAKLIGIVEARVKYSESSRKFSDEKAHWWSRPTRVEGRMSRDRHFDLPDQLVAIEALGFAQNECVRNYLRNVAQEEVNVEFKKTWKTFSNAKGDLAKELRQSSSIDISTRRKDGTQGIFVDNGYLLLLSAISNLQLQ